MRRRICVQLGSKAGEALDKLLAVNRCTTSDAVNAAIIAFAYDNQPTIFPPVKPETDILEQIGNVAEWCNSRGIKRQRLVYAIRRSLAGHTISGFGNSRNKYRDKDDGREFKTHTAWIAHCLKQDFNIDI